AVVTDPAVTPEQFRAAMSAFAVGETIKITGIRRHPAADRLLLDNLDLSSAHILDVGASDGSTSIDLIEQLPEFASYVIADLYLYTFVVTAGRRRFFYAPTGECFMVVGPRMLAWPSQSKLVRLAYQRMVTMAGRKTPEKVLLVNPQARALAADDNRIQFAVHDVFTPWSGAQPDVIKVANLLRRDYFPDDKLQIAMAALLASLPEGGHLLLVNNPRVKGVPCAAGLYRRQDGRFVRLDETEHLPDVDDLVRAASLPDPTSIPAQRRPHQPARTSPADA
ncbi:MAG: hypothetical protein ABWZ02_10895, partial [Nakamurella sp.]